MNIELKDGTSIGVYRMYKSYDISNSQIRLNVELANGADPEDMMHMDFSEFALKRDGLADKAFEGFVLEDVSENYDDRSTSVSLTLTKEIASA